MIPCRTKERTYTIILIVYFNFILQRNECSEACGSMLSVERRCFPLVNYPVWIWLVAIYTVFRALDDRQESRRWCFGGQLDPLISVSTVRNDLDTAIIYTQQNCEQLVVPGDCSLYIQIDHCTLTLIYIVYLRFVWICQDIADSAYKFRKGRPQTLPSFSILIADTLFSLLVQTLFLVQVSINIDGNVPLLISIHRSHFFIYRAW